MVEITNRELTYLFIGTYIGLILTHLQDILGAIHNGV